MQQIIPLPEAHDYQIQLREKEHVSRKQRAEITNNFTKFWQGVIEVARRRGTRHGGRTPGTQYWLGGSSGVPGLGFNFSIVRDQGRAELYIDTPDAKLNEDIYDRLYALRKEIESRFGGPLTWERLDTRRACRIKYVVEQGGIGSPETMWPEIQEAMVDAMIRLEAALGPALESLSL